MATVIDAFVLELGLDSSKFTRGQREAMESLRRMQEVSTRAGTEVEAHSKRIFELLSNVRREAIMTIAGFFGGEALIGFVNHITSLDAATGRLALTLGMNTTEVSAWQSAFKQAGQTAEGANAALSGLSGEMNRFALTGQSAMLPVLSRLGISLYDSNRNLKSSGQLWLELADAVHGMDPRQATAFLSMIPGANQEMINFALLGRRAMESYLDAARRAGLATKESADAAAQYQKAVGELETAWTNLGRTIVGVVVGPITSALRGIQTIITSSKGEIGAGAGRTPEAAGEAIGSFIEWMLGRSTPAGGVERTITGYRTSGGISIKPGAGVASPAMERVAGILKDIPEIRQVTAFNDAYHAGRGAHGEGRALDVVIADPTQSGAVAARIRAVLAAQGVEANVIDEYRNPSTRSTGGHIHVGVSRAGAATLGAANAQAASGRAGAGAGAMTVTIGAVNVNAPHATDADGIGKEITPALRRSLSAAAANYGQQ